MDDKSTRQIPYWSPLRSVYFPGELINRDIFSVDGNPLGQISFRIDHSPGSGFSGQVYRAVPLERSLLPPVVAIKVLRPSSNLKTWLRDMLFQICFQTSYAPRLREEALRTGLLWQVILRKVIEEELGDNRVISEPYGYYWDPDFASYVEIHEWIDGRPAHNEPDELLLTRMFQRSTPQPSNEMTDKKLFMDWLVMICRQIGALGLARQYEWWTFVSQNNVLTRVRPEENEYLSEKKLILRRSGDVLRGNFCAVDFRVGLAIPFFLPVTPVHARIIFKGLRQGILTHFDEVDFALLDNYLADHPSLIELAPVARKLKENDSDYRSSLPDVWRSFTRLLKDPGLRRYLRFKAVQDMVRCRKVSNDLKERLVDNPILFYGLLFLSYIPLFGSKLCRWAGHSGYRQHLKYFFSDEVYHTKTLRIWKERDLPTWLAQERISVGHIHQLDTHLHLFMIEKILLSWLPSQVHRLFVEPIYISRYIETLILHPIRLLFSQEARFKWLINILDTQYQRGILSKELLNIHKSQISEPRMQGYIRDLGFITGLDLLSRLVYLILGLYGINTGNFLPFGIAALSPIPPSGPIRVLYLIAQAVIDPCRARKWGQPIGRVLESRIAAILIAPWRWFGNLFPLVEISSFYTRLSFLLAEFFISRAADKIPIFGGEGKLLEYSIFQLCYNLPISLRHELKKKRK